MKRILVNATQPEELRVALVDGQKLHDLDIETAAREQRKANVYKGKITRLEPSLEAAFVDYGAERHGFLPLKEVSRDLFKKAPGDGRINIKEVLSEGQEIIVQVEKEERGNKGAALTTFISLAGRFLVLMPNNPRAGGVSRRIEGQDREEIREAIAELEIPEGGGVIVRTAGIGRSVEELQWDLNNLKDVWSAISQSAEDRPASYLIYQESNVIIRALRDYFRPDVGEVLIDSRDVFVEAQQFMRFVMPQYLSKIKLYEDEIPLFTRYQVESQIETAFERVVQLPSGGSLVIDPTEALTSIDINSARATGGSSIEETAIATNLEAAEEIARQLRLRDVGGLIVIDFIDMGHNRNQRDVENRLRDSVKQDRARVQLGRISRFGLMEMSRQRLRPSLEEHTQIVCPRCSGQGRIRGIESLSLAVLRVVEEEAMKERTGRIIAQLPVPVATFLLNEKRGDVGSIERRCKVSISLLPNPSLETPHYEIRRVRDDQVKDDGNDQASYELETTEASAEEVKPVGEKVVRATEKPAVSTIAPTSPIPEPTTPAKAQAPRIGIFTRLWLFLFGGFGTATKKPKKKQATKGRRDNAKQQTRRGRNERSDRGRGEQGKGKGSRNRNDNRGNQKNAENRNESKNKNRRNNKKTDEKGRQNNQQNPKSQDGQSQDGNNKGRGRRRGGRNEATDQKQQTQGNQTPKNAANANPQNKSDDASKNADKSAEPGNSQSVEAENATRPNAGGENRNGEEGGRSRSRRGRRGGRRGGRRNGNEGNTGEQSTEQGNDSKKSPTISNDQSQAEQASSNESKRQPDSAAAPQANTQGSSPAEPVVIKTDAPVAPPAASDAKPQQTAQSADNSAQESHQSTAKETAKSTPVESVNKPQEKPAEAPKASAAVQPPKAETPKVEQPKPAPAAKSQNTGNDSGLIQIETRSKPATESKQDSTQKAAAPSKQTAPETTD